MALQMKILLLASALATVEGLEYQGCYGMPGHGKCDCSITEAACTKTWYSKCTAKMCGDTIPAVAPPAKPPSPPKPPPLPPTPPPPPRDGIYPNNGACPSPLVLTPAPGQDLAIYNGVPLNEPCYASDSCNGYPTCCVKAGTCISEHGGRVSSIAKNYEGGCYSDESSKKSFNTGDGCTQAGECDSHFLKLVQGSTTKDAAENMNTLTPADEQRLAAKDLCMCTPGFIYSGGYCNCDPDYIESSCYRNCKANLTRCDGVPSEKVEGQDDGLSTAAIIGISVGAGVGGLIILAGVGYLIMGKGAAASAKGAATAKGAADADAIKSAA
jgi:hypothetical protein